MNRITKTFTACNGETIAGYSECNRLVLEMETTNTRTRISIPALPWKLSEFEHILLCCFDHHFLGDGLTFVAGVQRIRLIDSMHSLNKWRL